MLSKREVARRANVPHSDYINWTNGKGKLSAAALGRVRAVLAAEQARVEAERTTLELGKQTERHLLASLGGAA